MGSLVVFDLDGTLIDSRRDLAAAANVGRSAVDLPPLPLETIVSFVGDGIGALMERLIPDAALRTAATAAFSAHYRDHCSVHTQVYPGVKAAMASLAASGWQLGVATNKPLHFAQRILDDLDLTRWIGDRVRGGDVMRKPDPGQLLSLLAQTQADPTRSWMVGDHHTDILAARAAGLRVLWCAWGLGHADGHAVDATAAQASDWPRLIGTPA